MTFTDKQLELRALVLDHFISTGRAATIKELAEHSKKTTARSEAWLRTHLWDTQGFILDGIEEHDVLRPSFSKDYKHLETGSHKVRAFMPSAVRLREVILDATAMLKGIRGRADEILADAQKDQHLETDLAVELLERITKIRNIASIEVR